MAIAQQRKTRAAPGSKGTGNYFRVIVRPKEEFVTFRTQDVGDPGHIQRVAGKRRSGSWDTQAWLISKKDAHVEQDKLVPDTKEAKELIDKLGSKPVRAKADILRAKDRPNVPERAKPTAAQKRAQAANIEKAQAARHK